jgi:aryl-alcohol dehydrogenase-like predicted oxidoreductase
LSLLSREIEKDVLPFCRERGIATIVYSPLEQGILTGKVGLDRTFPDDDYRSDQPWFKLENRRRALGALERVGPIAARRGCTLAQLAIAWTIGEPGVTAAIVEARTPAQVVENAGEAAVRLAPEERAEIAAA